MKNSELPAMPLSLSISESEGYTTQDFYNDSKFNGLSKREMFAMHAMNGYLSMLSNHGNAIDCNKLAEKSVSYADALLKELSK